MQILGQLSEFSRTYCVSICAVMVSANVMASLQTLFWVGGQRPFPQIGWMAGVATFYALVMMAHVATWLSIGVIMPPTFILLGFGSLCLLTNAWAVFHPVSLQRFLRYLLAKVRPTAIAS
ncbi:MAG: hypothetical protein NW237_11730 [Cyanobacteriota bacterium]|nr:hypothetical protein [Cyanobacteriota bacterium]